MFAMSGRLKYLRNGSTARAPSDIYLVHKILEQGSVGPLHLHLTIGGVELILTELRTSLNGSFVLHTVSSYSDEAHHPPMSAGRDGREAEFERLIEGMSIARVTGK